MLWRRLKKTMHQEETKNCQNCKKNFVIESEDFNFYEKIKVPAPTWCPECRAMRRLIWRNERSLYHNTCAFSGKNLISMFSPETKLVMYDHDIWWSDKWDPLTYGQDYDFSRPFFEQYKELLQRVPLMNLGNINCLQGEYGNHNTDCKKFYLAYACYGSENISYSQGTVGVKDSIDLYTVMKSEKCYENVTCTGLYQTHFSYDSDDSIDSAFLTCCINLQNCLGCINLRHKSYCIFNKQYSKADYENERAKYDFGSYQALENFKEKYNDFIKTEPRRFASILKSTNVTGDNIINSKNSKNIFDVYGDVEDSKYVAHVMDLKDSYDLYGGGIASLLYEGVDEGVDAFKQFFGLLTHSCLETNYTYMCYGSEYLFGCIGLRNQNHCILNKKYSKEEYEKLMPKMIEHMNTVPYVDSLGRIYRYGEFFPTDLSPFAYNETIAGEYYTLNKKEAKGYGFKWKEKEERDYKIEIKTENLPDHIKEVDESIIGKIIGCLHKGECEEQCTEAFKILDSEFQFYKKNNFALPRLCPNCRHFQRLKKRNPIKLWHRSCMCEKQGHFHGQEKCEVQFETSYAPDRPEIIYCEKCYQQEVY